MGVSMAIALAVLAIGFSAVVADAAPGLEPGVHADPGSPAAKEYALPLDQARQTGSPPKGGSSRAVPFGAGIHPPGGSGSGSSAGESPRHGAAGKGTSLVAASNASGSSTRAIIPAAVLRAASERGSSGGGGSILALIGGGVAILVLGGFGGMVMRRSHRATPLA
jgi:hypothetical protein